MTSFGGDTVRQLDELLTLLETDTQYLRTSLQRLDQLRALLIKRDEPGLSELLRTVQAESALYQANELRRRQLGRTLASALGLPAEKLRLSDLQGYLPDEKRQILARKHSELRELVQRVHREYEKTAMLLAELARFNRQLLEAVVTISGQSIITYQANGSAKFSADAAFINCKF